MIDKTLVMIKFCLFIGLLNLLVVLSILFGASLGDRKLIMYEETVDPKGKTVSTTPIYAYAYCKDCPCKDK